MDSGIGALLNRYDRAVPRYTSYPTAPHFTPSVNRETYARWLGLLAPDAQVSLYLHVPFCDQLCLFCGCHTTVVRGDGPKETYGAVLESEIALVAEHLGERRRVMHIHWGGGTPSALPAASLAAINAALDRYFDVSESAEIAVEVDPRTLPADRLAALAALGITRASLGVQDFDARVQRAIGRIQPFEATRDCAERLRGIGVRSLNLDLMYGLPYQTADSVSETVGCALALAPERVAVFGYAHVPWIKRQQRLMPEEALPDARSRFAQQAAAHSVLTRAGYRAIGLDHFARPGDRLAEAAESGRLRRNFQGYTADETPVLLGLGASAIGSLPQGYVQNAVKVPGYAAAVRSGALPIARGVALAPDDRMRRTIIESLMCDMRVDLGAIAEAHVAEPRVLASERDLRAMAEDGLIRWDGERIEVTALGRPFVRTIAALFDAYLQPHATGHTPAI